MSTQAAILIGVALVIVAVVVAFLLMPRQPSKSWLGQLMDDLAPLAPLVAGI